MRLSKAAIIGLAISATLFTGCSLKNPFGIGYDTSVSETSKSKTFGVSGSPKDIYKHRDIIRKTQDEYLSSGIKDVLYFGIDKKGNMLVKKDRDEEWQKYETSPWKDKIDEANKKNKEKEDELEKKRAAKAKNEYIGTKKYIDNEGNLVSSHELYVVVKEPSWIVGEKTPKTMTNMSEIPTPISKNMLQEQTKSEKADERIVGSYVRDDPIAVTNAINDAPSIEDEQDTKIIRNFIKGK